MTTATVTNTREYIVLAQANNGQWDDIGRMTAGTAKQAIARTIDELHDQDGTFVAIPVRSWQPITRSTETVTKAKWS